MLTCNMVQQIFKIYQTSHKINSRMLSLRYLCKCDLMYDYYFCVVCDLDIYECKCEFFEFQETFKAGVLAELMECSSRFFI
jgi:hypothetical protein